MRAKAVGVDYAARFWSRVDQSDPDGCWPWMGGRRNSKGYGGFWDVKKWGYAHRYAFQSKHGRLLPGEEVCHHCDNPPCCRDEHHFRSTRKGNAEDMSAKGRGSNGSRLHPERQPRGEQNGQSKVTAEIVATIRRRYADGGISQRALGLEYGLTQVTVGEIVRRLIWQHVA